MFSYLVKVVLLYSIVFNLVFCHYEEHNYGVNEYAGNCYGTENYNSKPLHAVSIFSEGNNITFTQEYAGGPVILKGFISNLGADKILGMHIHQLADATKDCNSQGLHFNPTYDYHGGRYTKHRHFGDLGNIVTDADGNAIFEIAIWGISLSSCCSCNSILGRTIVIHENPDDEGKLSDNPESAISGNSGNAITCAAIVFTGAEYLY